MPDGVGWAATEIVVFLVIATLIGLAIGWVLGRWLQAREIAEAHETEVAAQQELARKAEHRLTGSNKRLDEFQLELKGNEARIAELEEELAACLAAGEVVMAADVEVADPPVAAPLVSESISKEDGLARIVEIAERTAGGAPIADDDLKQIHGIGPKLERMLKDLGITSFRQIANFETDDVVYVTAALDAFKGRIERDDWMSSAAAHHMRKYDSPA
ncbi:MAG: hypothetical protein GY722_22620 [bacterium]|nr:hypothetical protein [bacterium]